jgi:hypothetical protein
MEYCPYESAFDILPKKDEKKKKRTKIDTSFLDKSMADDSVYRPALGNKSDILSLQNFSEAFVDISSNITVPPVNKFKPLPKYFTGEEDDDSEGFTDTIGSQEVVTQEVITQENNSSSSSSVNINDGWKPVTRSNTYTAFYDTTTPSLTQMKNERQKQIKPKEVSNTNDNSNESNQSNDNSNDNSNELVNKINILFHRLDALEKECKGDINKNNQKEILMFVGTGFIFLFGLHLLRR